MHFSWINRYSIKVALFAIFFASIAPTISHVLASQSNSNSFMQEVCTSTGQKFYVEVMTSKGNLLKTALDIQPADQQHAPTHHLKHCPFCANPSVDTAIEAPHALIVQRLTQIQEKRELHATVLLPKFSVLPPPAQAPPTL